METAQAMELQIRNKQLNSQKSSKDTTQQQLPTFKGYKWWSRVCICIVFLLAGQSAATFLGRLYYDKLLDCYLVANFISWFVGVDFGVSSLFSNVISTIPVLAIPILAVIFFHDKMDGVKIIFLILAIWGFLSYVYQHYLDDVKVK
ncbi:unnamed protein product [Coffea canephora]|uniref:Uncharacterized protein n=1 Tax=Coffea canephora TaxID=49390 RepID=A0A068UYA4_COFCA|nr:unnamed protein product [Coffea canephora]